MPETTEMQQRFVVAFTSEPGAIGNASEAARRAGYSEKTASEIGRQLLEKEHVKEAIFESNKAQISGKLATKAVAVLETIVDDTDAPIKARLDAAKTILDRAGHIAPKADDPRQPSTKPIGEMTVVELEAFIRQGQIGVDASPVIDVTPVSPERSVDNCVESEFTLPNRPCFAGQSE